MVLGAPPLWFLISSVHRASFFLYLLLSPISKPFQRKEDWFIRVHTTVVEAAPWWPLPSGEGE